MDTPTDAIRSTVVAGTGEAIAAQVAAITAHGGTVVRVGLVASADGGAAVAARVDYTAAEPSLPDAPVGARPQ